MESVVTGKVFRGRRLILVVLLGVFVFAALVVAFIIRPQPQEDPLANWKSKITYDESFPDLAIAPPNVTRIVIVKESDLNEFVNALKAGPAPEGPWTWAQIIDAVGSHGTHFHYQAAKGSEQIFAERQGIGTESGVKLRWSKPLTTREVWQVRLKRLFSH